MSDSPFAFLESENYYAIHINSIDELEAFSAIEQEYLYERIVLSGSGSNLSIPIAVWNRARWDNAEHHLEINDSDIHDVGMYLTLDMCHSGTIEIGWETNLDWLEDHEYTVIECGDIIPAYTTAYEPVPLNSIDDLLL